MDITPQVSVIVPAYNIENYIEATLNSLEQQTFKAFEAIIVNDGSTDGTVEKVKPFTDRDARFRLVTKPNGGLASARNYGIHHAKCEYIALLDGDDIYDSEKLANHVDILTRNPKVGAVYSASRAIRDDGGSTFMVLDGKPLYRDPLLSLLCKNFVGHGSNAVMRRAVVDDVGEFDETLRSSEDIDYWLRVAATRKWEFYRVPQILCGYRVRPSGLSFNVERMLQCRTRVIEAAYQRSPEIVRPMLATAYAYLYRYLARLSLTAGDATKARDFIDQAIAQDAAIFFKDVRSLSTLLAVRLAPLTQIGLQRTLGTLKSVKR